MNTPGDFKPGHDPRRSLAGKKGRAGRPTNEFRALCRTLADDPTVLANVKRVLMDPDHRHFERMWKDICEFGHGKALQAIEMTGPAPEIKVILDG